MGYSIKDSTLSVIKSREGFAAYRYPDGSENGVPKFSIGYGHQILPTDTIYEPLSRDDATKILKNDLEKRLPNLNKVLPEGLTENQFNELIDYSMSFGIDRILTAGLYEKIRNFAPVDEIKKWWASHYITSNGIYNQGLVNRRNLQIRNFFAESFPPVIDKKKVPEIILFIIFALLIIFLIYLIFIK